MKHPSLSTTLRLGLVLPVLMCASLTAQAAEPYVLVTLSVVAAPVATAPAPVPGLSDWMVAVLAMILVALAAVTIRRAGGSVHLQAVALLSVALACAGFSGKALMADAVAGPNDPSVDPPINAPLFEVRTAEDGFAPLANIFISSGAIVPTFVAQVFGGSDEVSDAAQFGFGTTADGRLFEGLVLGGLFNDSTQTVRVDAMSAFGVDALVFAPLPPLPPVSTSDVTVCSLGGVLKPGARCTYGFGFGAPLVR